MSVQERSFLFVFLGLVLSGFLVVFLSQRDSGGVVQHSTALPTASQQALKNRSWVAVPSKLSVISRVGGEPLYRPFSLKSDQEGNLYVIDFGDVQIKKISKTGELLLRLGKGKGSAPGEFRNPIDYDFDSQNNIWVCDSETALITVFDRNGKVVRTVRIPATPLRIVVISQNRFLLMLNSREQLFGVFDTTGKQDITFGSFIENQIKHDIVLDGWLTPIRNQGFVYAPLYAGFLAKFSYDGDALFYTHTIVSSPWPKAVESSEGGVYVDRNAPVVLRDVCNFKDTIYTLSRFGLKSDQESAIDAYSKQDGRYLYSIRLPQKARSALVTADNIYTLADTTITIWGR